MTAFTFISNALVAVGAKPFATTVQAFRDNILSGLEADASAPVNQSHWHPYNKVTNGDANTGLIYSFGVSGAVANVVSPDFVDGYEYRFIVSGISSSSNAADFSLELYRETDGAYGDALPMATISNNTQSYSGQIVVNRPRVARTWHLVEYVFAITSSTGSASGSPSARVCVRSAQKRLRARFSFSVGNIDAGQIFMEKRRCI